ncbi:MAG: 7-carboxy-7-deazaguanine synthase [Pseudomonadota bacterium]
MTYSVKEIFYTLQGEGGNAGRPAVFCRFAGCNLWSGLERDRGSAICQFCDTDFVGTDGTLGGKYRNAETLAAAIASLWPNNKGTNNQTGQTSQTGQKLTVLTGGEPLLQVNPALIDALHALDFEIAVESNGTVLAPAGIDHLCISPKAGALDAWVQKNGQELKLVWPQPSFDLDALSQLPFARFYLQPMDGPDKQGNTEDCIALCLAKPRWQLSLQTHKITGIR